MYTLGAEVFFDPDKLNDFWVFVKQLGYPVKTRGQSIPKALKSLFLEHQRNANINLAVQMKVYDTALPIRKSLKIASLF